MEIIKLYIRINKNHKHLRIPYENYENHENHNFPIENQEHHENH